MIKLASKIEIAGDCNVRIRIVGNEYMKNILIERTEKVDIATLPEDKNILIQDESGVWFLVAVDE